MSDTSPEPITVSVKTAAAMSGLSNWTIYKRLDEGAIASVYDGTRRLVVVESLRAYLAGLPTARPEAEASA